MKNRSNQMIEAMRYICCLVVLCIHCNMPQPVGNLFNKYGRFAVPFFLLVSGYYAYSYDLTEKSIKKFKQTLHIVLIHGSFCIAWNCANSYFGSGSLISWAHPYFSINTAKELLLFNRAIFINSSFYYFFLLLYLYLFCVFVGRCKHISITGIYCLSAILYITGYCIYHFLNKPWYFVGNFLFTGIPLFFLGHMLHSKFHMFVLFFKKPLIVIGIGVVTTYAETHLLHGTYMTIGQVLVAVALLFICVNNSHKNMGTLAMLGSECSMFVMIYHCQIRDTVSLIINKYSWRFPLIVLVFTTSLGILYSQLKSISK